MKGKVYLLIDAIAWTAIVTWVGLSAYFFFVGNADLFQRFGTFGIVFGVTYYAVLSPPVVHPLGQIESLVWKDKRLVQVEGGVVAACANVSLLAASVQQTLESESRVVPESIKILARPTLERIQAGKPYPMPVNQDKVIETIAHAMVAADADASHAERVRFITQATLVVIGTLQAGFGSMIVPAGVAH